MKRLLLLCGILQVMLCTAKEYPKDYFRNPLNIPILLAGNFGECRPGHFHSGIDIKTNGKENLPVYAAASGYISRIKLEPGGFGHAIYITHPNGYTTLYAHLNDFTPALQLLVRSRQYQKKEWTLDQSFTSEQYPVAKGQQIAWSGNTGGSTAPHLHFEIRDTRTEHPLNPLLFGFAVTDNIAPVPYQLALYDLRRSVYEQQPRMLILKKRGAAYEPLPDTIQVSTDQLGLGIYVQDYMNGSDNTLSFYTANWYAGTSLQGTMTLDDIGYEETRYLNACADYTIKQQTGNWFNSCFLLPANQLKKIYSNLSRENGAIFLAGNEPQPLSLVLQDAMGNTSTVALRVVLKKDSTGTAPCERLFKAGSPAQLDHPNIRFTMPAGTLYDDACFRFTSAYDPASLSARYQLHTAEVPLHNYFELSVKPDKPVPFALTGKVVLLCDEGSSVSGRAAVLKDGWYSARVRSLGNYRLVTDTAAPLIQPLQKNGSVVTGKKEIRFRVTDNRSSVKEFRGMLNGQWLCFEQHGSYWFYRFDSYCPKGKHTLQLSATDENGNERRMSYTITR